MFKKLKSYFSKSKRLTFSEKARNYPLEDKPFARNLIYRASQYLDEENDYLEKTDFKELGIGVSNKKYQIIKDAFKRASLPNQWKTLEEFTELCAIQLAFRITLKSMDNIGLFPVYIPTRPLPKEAPFVAAFAILLVKVFQSQLKKEWIYLDSSLLDIKTGELFFLTFSQEKKKLYIMQALDIGYILTNDKSQNITNWLDQLTNIIFAYIMQFGCNENEYFESVRVKDIDFIPAFGKVLAGLLNAIEY